MEQRASSLQQRLQARRDMFFNKEGAGGNTSSNGGTPTYGSTRLGKETTRGNEGSARQDLKK